MSDPQNIDAGRIRGLIFDAYGTLMRGQPQGRILYWHRSLDRQQKRTVRKARMRGELSDAQLLQIGEADTAPTPEQFRAMEHERLQSNRLYDDVAPVLDELLRRGYPMAILSNAPAVDGPVIAGLVAPWTTAVLVSAALGVTKPDPAAFRAAGEALGLPPQSLLMVGDGARSDVRGARNAGLQAVQIDRRGEPPRGLTTLRPLLDLLP